MMWCCFMHYNGASDATATATTAAACLTHSTRWPQYSRIKAVDLASCVKCCWIMPALAPDAQLVLAVDSMLLGIAFALVCIQQLLISNRIERWVSAFALSLVYITPYVHLHTASLETTALLYSAYYFVSFDTTRVCYCALSLRFTVPMAVSMVHQQPLIAVTTCCLQLLDVQLCGRTTSCRRGVLLRWLCDFRARAMNAVLYTRQSCCLCLSGHQNAWHAWCNGICREHPQRLLHDYIQTLLGVAASMHVT
jgi:hypothetical protein